MSTPLDPNEIKTPEIPGCECGTVRLRPAETVFNVDGFKLKLVLRENDVAIYEKSKGSYIGYETVIIRRSKPNPNYESDFDIVETYPGNNLWGELGWTHTDYQEAYRKFCKLTRHTSKRNGQKV